MIHAPFSYGFHIGRWTKQLKLVLKQLYQFYGIENIDEYIKHEEEDTDSESDSENGDQNHKAAVLNDTYAEPEETKRRKPNGDEENRDLPVDDTENPEGEGFKDSMKPKETKMPPKRLRQKSTVRELKEKEISK